MPPKKMGITRPTSSTSSRSSLKISAKGLGKTVTTRKAVTVTVKVVRSSRRKTCRTRW